MDNQASMGFSMDTLYRILGNYGVSIASCIQQEVRDGKPVPVVLMTHETREAELRKALAEIDQLEFTREATHAIRVLQE